MESDVFFVNLWITLKCNFRCRYCYVQEKYKNIDLSRRTADEFIKFIKKNIKIKQRLIINFHGGEPTINFDILKYIVQRLENEIDNNVDFGITTNGSLLNDEMVLFISKHCNYNISISMDGMNDTTEMNRKCLYGDGSFENISNNALKLLQYSKNVRIRMTYDRRNINELSRNICNFIHMGFTNIVPVADYFSKNWSDDDFKIVELEFKKVKNFINSNNISNVKIYDISDDYNCLSPCTAGHDYYSIDVLGNIYPCTLLVGDEEHLLGNIYKGIDFNKLLQIDEINKKKVDECSECQLYRFCKSVRCLFINYVTEGDYYKPNLVSCNLLNIKHNLC